MMNALFD
jgi:serine/threonine protein kinase